MAFLDLPNTDRLWFGGTEVESLWYGDLLIFGPDIPLPATLVEADWDLDAEPAGPFAAVAFVTLPEINALALEWSSGDGWMPAIRDGNRWRLCDGEGDCLFPAGTYSGIFIRWRSGTNNRFSLGSADTKGFTFADYAIDPVVATIEVELIPGTETSFDAATGFEQVPPDPDWEKGYRIIEGANLLPPHRWEGSVLIVDTPADAPAGTVTVTFEAFFAAYPPAPLVGFYLSGGEILFTSDGDAFIPAE